MTNKYKEDVDENGYPLDEYNGWASPSNTEK